MPVTIRDKLRSRITRSTLGVIPPIFVGGTGVVMGWITLKPHFVANVYGCLTILACAIYVIWLTRFARFPCPKCGTDLWVKTGIPHQCPNCGLSLDQPWHDPKRRAS